MSYYNGRNSRFRFYIILIWAATLVVGLLIAAKYNNYFLLGDMELQNNDDVRYFNTARVLIEQGKMVYYGNEPTTFIMPGYPFFLGAVLKLFGIETYKLFYVRAAQVLLQSFAVVLLYLIGKELFNKRIGLIAALFSLLYIPDYIASNLILTEAVYRFIFIALFYVSILALKRRSTKYYVITGVVWSILCLFRPNAATYPLLLAIIWLIEKYSFKEMLKYTLLITVIFTALFSPWWIRNYGLRDRFILFTDSSANPRLLGMFIKWGLPSFADEIPDELMYKEFVKYNFAAGPGITEESMNKLANYMFFTGLKKEPKKYIMWHTVGKTKELYNEPYYWKPILGISFESMKKTHLTFILAGVVGMLLMMFRREKGGTVLAVLLIISTLTYLPFITFSRYGYPNIFMFIIGSAYAVDFIYSKIMIRFQRTESLAW